MPGPQRFKCHYCRETVEFNERVRAVLLICYTNTASFHEACVRKLHSTGRRPGAPSARYAIVRIQDQER